MNLKKPISAAMAAVMTLSVTATPAIAAAEDPPGMATQADETETDATLGEQSSAEEDALNGSDTSEKSHQDAKVYASANGSYILTVPESINLHNVEKKDLGSGLYTNDKNCKVNLRGDVRQDQVVVVTVTEPVMQSEGSKDVDATVDTSSKTVWNRDDMFTGAAAGEDGSYTEPTGVTTVYPVSAELTPGDWVGTAMFNCSLETTSSIASAITGIDPASFDYDGQEHSPSLVFADGSSLVEGKDYVISGDTAKVDEGDYSITITGAGKYIGSVSFDWKIKKYDITSDISASLDKTDFVADDTEHAPNIIWGGGSNLVEGADYEISGTKSATDPGNYQITITGKGKYKGTLTLDWTISATDIANAVEGLDNATFEENGDTHAPNIIWKDGFKLKDGVDYEVTGTTSASDAGNYTITIAGKGKYKGTLDLEWKVAEKPDIALAVSGITPVHFNYDGATHSPTLTWNEGYANLIEGKDYTLSGNISESENWEYTLTVTGKGKYKGTVSFDWNIGKLIPVGASYRIDSANEWVTGDGISVCFPSKAYKNDTYIDEDYEYNLYSGGWSVRVRDKTKTSYSALRSYICDRPITDLSGTFCACKSLVVAPSIPNTVTCMDQTFADCYSLLEAPVIPDSVTDMVWAFRSCKLLKTYTGSTDPDGDFSSYVIPDSVTNTSMTFSECSSLTRAPVISNSTNDMQETFYGCTSLVEAPVIPDGVTDMGGTFFGCSSLETYAGSTDPDGDFSGYKIPDNVTNMIGTFYGCASLTNAPIIPRNVTELGHHYYSDKGTFQNCTSLTKAPAIPDSVTNMYLAFSGCESLAEAPVISDNVTDMGYTFSGCTSLKTYTGSTDPDGDFSNYVIPDSVTDMDSTFKGCTFLKKSPVLGSSVTNMQSTFKGCTSLMEAPLIPNSVTTMGFIYTDYGTFQGCTALKTYSGSTDLDGDFSNYKIPDSVNNMNSTFSDCASLVNAPAIPDSVTYMNMAFSACTSLTGTLNCNANPSSCYNALEETKINKIIGDCSEATKIRLLNSTHKTALTNGNVTLVEDYFTYDGTLHAPQIQYNGKTLTAGKDYNLTGDTEKTDCGEYTVTVTGINNYIGIVDLTWYIGNRYIGDAVAGVSQDFFEYDGNEHSPGINWNDEFESLAEGQDYLILSTKSATNAGDYTISIKGLGEYGGIISFEWRIGELIPVGAVYTINSTGEQLTGDGVSVCFPLNAYKNDKYVDSDYEYNCSDNGWAVKVKDKTKASYGALRSDIGGKKLISLYQSFKDCTAMTEAPSIPDSVIHMQGTFCDCTSLTEAPAIPDNVKYMGGMYYDEGSFYNCKSLKTYAGSNDPDGDFSNYKIPDGVTNMVYAFADCTSLTEAPVIPDSVINMNRTFACCKSLVMAPIIGNSVTDMGYTFSGCTSLTEAPAIPDSVTDMECTFNNCTSLTEVRRLGNNVTNMKSTLQGCSSLVKVSAIPDSVTNMGSTFKGCVALNEAPEIGKRVTSMYYAFSGCTSLTKVSVIPDSVTNMQSTFDGCTSLVEAPEIGNSVTNMGSTFYDCKSLTEAPVIPEAVTNMGSTFKGCTSLTGTLICNANPISYSGALRGTKITTIEGFADSITKVNLLATR